MPGIDLTTRAGIMHGAKQLERAAGLYAQACAAGANPGDCHELTEFYRAVFEATGFQEAYDAWQSALPASADDIDVLGFSVLSQQARLGSFIFDDARHG